MASFSIRYESLGYLRNTLDEACARGHEWIASNYRIASRLSRLTSVYGNNISSCNYYIQKKNECIQERIDRITNIKSSVDAFVANVRAADRRVAEYVKSESNAFYTANEISVGLGFLCYRHVGRNANIIAKNVMMFYEENKYLIDLIVDGLLLVAAAAVFFIPGLNLVASLFALWVFAQSVSDFISSANAYSCFLAGDINGAEMWAERNLLKERFDNCGYFGTFVYNILNIGSAIYSFRGTLSEVKRVVQFAENALKADAGAMALLKELFGINTLARRGSNSHSAELLKAKDYAQRFVDLSNDYLDLFRIKFRIKLNYQPEHILWLFNIRSVAGTTYNMATIAHGFKEDGFAGAILGTKYCKVNEDMRRSLFAIDSIPHRNPYFDFNRRRGYLDRGLYPCL
jgi:ABC-type multidrug transport system fused ATPase/permease subunit